MRGMKKPLRIALILAFLLFVISFENSTVYRLSREVTEFKGIRDSLIMEVAAKRDEVVRLDDFKRLKDRAINMGFRRPEGGECVLAIEIPEDRAGPICDFPSRLSSLLTSFGGGGKVEEVR
jgi:hypothetical protein